MEGQRTYKLDHSESEPPLNADGFSVNLNYDNDASKNRQTISLSEVTFVRENYDKIKTIYENGGVYSGVPWEWSIESTKVFDGYLDLTTAKWSNDRVTVVAKEKQQIDWLNDRIDSASYPHLYQLGLITPDQMQFIPYIVNSIPDYQQAALALVTVYMLQQQISQQITQLGIIIAKLSTKLDIAAVIECVLQLIYITSLLIALVLLVRNIIKLLIQPVKYHACMYVKDLMVAGFKYFGLEFKSELFDTEPFKNLVYMPPKRRNPPNEKDKRILGFTIPSKTKQTGFPDSDRTVGDFIRAFKLMFKYKLVITEKQEAFFVQDSFDANDASCQLPDVYEPEHTDNSNELKSNRVIRFLTDLNDKNTIQQYKGTSYQIITTQISNSNPDYDVLKGLQEDVIPFSLAKAKTDLTTVEEILRGFAVAFDALVGAMVFTINVIIKLINAVTKAINKIVKALGVVGINVKFVIKPIKNITVVSFTDIVDNRLQMMSLETDFTDEPKVFLMSKGSEPKFNKIHALNESVVSAKYLYHFSHYLSVSFLPSVARPYGNQYKIREYKKVPFVYTDYLKVRNNNIIFAQNNKVGLLTTANWESNLRQADLTVRVNELFTNNLIETYYEPDGT